MQKEKAMIYPFDIEFCPIVRHKSLLSNYEITNLVSPIGWGFNNKDVASVDGGEILEMKIINDYCKALEQCETVIFSDSRYKLDMEKDILIKIKEAILKSKNIICTFEVDQEYRKELIELSEENHCYIKFFGNRDFENNNIINKNKDYITFYETLQKIETPIVFILGVTERICKFEIQLALREKLQNLGYKVSQIGSREYCELFGFYSFPQFMFSGSLSEVDKIVMFNNLVKNIEISENPDVIIVGIPGGTMKINNDITNKFGVFAYEISQALDPDYVIMSTFYEDFKPEYFEKLNISTKYKLGYEIDCFNLSNTQLDWMAASKLSNDIYIKLDNHFITEKLNSYKEIIPKVFNTYNKIDIMVENLVDKLNSYAGIELV